MTSTAGPIPTRNIARHELSIWPTSCMWPRIMLIPAAIMFPIAESAWSDPSAIGRARSDMTSATSETLTASCPPTPSPVRNRQSEKSQTPFERALSPVKAE